MSLQTVYCNQCQKETQTNCRRQTTSELLFHLCFIKYHACFIKRDTGTPSIVESVQMHFCCSFLPECCCHLDPSSAVLDLIWLRLNMSSSYAAAISALLSTSSPNPSSKPRPHPTQDKVGSPKPAPSPIAPSHHPPAAEKQPQEPEPLESYDEQQENPADYGIGRQHSNTKPPHTG